MNTQNPLTQQAYTRLVSFLQKVGNTLNIQHKMALQSLADAMTRMAEGKITGRLAFGLPTGTGKTTAIIEWCASVHALGLPYSIAVSSSRIDALVTMKASMMAAGIPEDMIGLLHESPKKGVSNTDAENYDRPILLMSHQMIRASEANLKRYNTYKGAARNLLIYDESLFTTDVNHFGTRPLKAALAGAIEQVAGLDHHAEIHNYMTECLQIIRAAEDKFFDGMALQMIPQPAIDPSLAAFYVRDFRKYGLISEFMKAANIPLRMVKAGTTAFITYNVVMPATLQNVIVLDASFPIRKLIHADDTVQNAELALNLKRQGVDFSTIKRFDHVEILRLKSYGGRNSMEKRFKDRQMAKEVVAVVKTLPTTDSILLYVYKQNQMGGTDYAKILQSELDRAGVDLSRIHIDTFGNETSLNSYGHCQHVFLVGVLHRADTELMGQYLAQTRNIEGELSRELVNDISLSERAHLAYQALSRGSCRFVDDGQARAMKGYLVEIDPEIETALATVMPGVKWTNWKPVFLPETDSLIEKTISQIAEFLSTFEGDKISSRKLKKTMAQEKISPMTWQRAVKGFCEKDQAPKKEHMGDGSFPWKLIGSSLVRVSAESYGFKAA